MVERWYTYARVKKRESAQNGNATISDPPSEMLGSGTSSNGRGSNDLNKIKLWHANTETKFFVEIWVAIRWPTICLPYINRILWLVFLKSWSFKKMIFWRKYLYPHERWIKLYLINIFLVSLELYINIYKTQLGNIFIS